MQIRLFSWEYLSPRCSKQQKLKNASISSPFNSRIKVFLFFHQKLLTYQITAMRGIQINNYFNNHITLNGKKLAQDAQPVVQSSRQKLQNQIQPEEQNNVEVKASPSKPQPTPLKKRTNTLVELKKHLPQKRSISVQRQRNAASAKKKEELLSDDEDKDEELLVNMSQKKFKPNSNKGGLGKRSKSTIIKTNHIEAHKDFVKKDSKKLNSNPTTESTKPLKSKRKKSSKISEIAKDNNNKQTLTSKISTARKEPPQTASKEVFKKEKLAIKLDKHIKSEKTEKKSARNHTKNLTLTQTKSSKPVSAREKKIKKNRFIEELKEKYENQTILEGQLSSSRLKGGEEGMDSEFLTVMNSLEKILNSVGSKQKLKKELEIINEKLREFKLETEEENDLRLNEEFSSIQKSKIQQNIRSLELDSMREERRPFPVQYDDEQNHESPAQSEEQEEQEPLPHKISEEDEIFMRLEGEEVKNPLISKRNNIFFVEEKQDNDQHDERKKEIELLKKFKNQSSKMMEKVGLTNINTQKIELNINTSERKLSLENVSGLSSNSNSNSHKWEDKYPQINPRSPKFDQSQLLGAIQLKEQFLSSKHDKMSELVKKMFEKQLVSPKSFEFQMKSLKKKYEEENLVLQSFKKQAEQLTSMLSEIKKDKEEIQGIDELIRNQKWEEAQKYVEKTETPLEKISEHEQYEKKWLKDHEDHVKRFELTGWEKESGWERVKIKKSEVENNEFVEIGEMTNRGRRRAEAHIDRLDIDQECGGTQESEELLPHEVRPEKEDEDEYIYYHEDYESDKNELDSGLIRLVQIPEEPFEDTDNTKSSADKVFHIKDEQPEKEEGHEASDNYSSLVSVPSQPERGGFVTNLYFIKEYCIAICEFVRDNDIFKSQFKLNVSKPLEFNIKSLLNEFREEENSSYTYSKRAFKPAIAESIWNEFNNQYETLKFNSQSSSHNDSKHAEKYRLEKEQEIIFIRMIFDVLNESLDFERPGGQFGKALPWRETARHLKNLKQLNKSEGDNVQAYDLMFGVAIARIIQWGSCLCGFLPDTVELENTEIDQAYVNHIRETRTAFLLEKMMAEQEVIMTNFELQEAEVQFRLGELIWQSLLEEAEGELSPFFE